MTQESVRNSPKRFGTQKLWRGQTILAKVSQELLLLFYFYLFCFCTSAFISRDVIKLSHKERLHMAIH